MPEKSIYNRLQDFTSNKMVLAELSAYTNSSFCKNQFYVDSLEDEPQIIAWEKYVAEAKSIGVYQTLKKYLVQFQFPIKKSISQSDDYKNATLRGASTKPMKNAIGLILREPKKLQLSIYPSLAGKIPVLIANNSYDFQSIVQALSYRNEPYLLPSSMGAAIIKGLNNWDRLRTLQRQFHNTLNKKQLLENKALYQDTIIVLSRKSYSNISAKDMGLKEEQWLDHSLNIRLAHECTHYFTLRHFGKMANNLYDELIADYTGISKVLPHYSSNWFLKFMGLEDYPIFKTSGRLKNYLGKPPLSTTAFKTLQQIVKQASNNLEVFDRQITASIENDPTNRRRKLLSLCNLNLIEIASEDGAFLLSEFYKKCEVTYEKGVTI